MLKFHLMEQKSEIEKIFLIFILFLGIIFLFSTCVSATGNISNNHAQLAAAKDTTGLATTAWPKFHHDNQNTCQSQYLGPQTNRMKWKYPTVGPITVSPTISSDGTIYFGSGFAPNNSFLYAVSPSGKLKWKYPRTVASTPAISSDGTIYFGTSGNDLIALNSNGKFKWQYKTGNIIKSSPSIANDGTIYFCSFQKNEHDNYLYALSPDGKLKWKYPAGTVSFSVVGVSPAVGKDGTIYVGSSDTYLYAITPNGTLKWKYKTGWQHSDPAIGSDGTIYFVTNNKDVGIGDSYLYALNPNKTFKWKYKTGISDYSSTPFVSIASSGVIYVAQASNLYAFTPEGKLKWNNKTANNITGSPSIGSDGTLFFGCKDKNMYSLSSNGTLKWKYLTGGSVSSSPIIAKDSTLYFGSEDTILYALQDRLTIKSFIPANKSKDVPLNQIIKVTFNRKILVGTTFNNITLKNSNGLSIDTKKTINNNVLTIQNAIGLFNQYTNYNLILPKSCVKDIYGQGLPISYTTSFTTKKSSVLVPSNIIANSMTMRNKNYTLPYNLKNQGQIAAYNTTIKIYLTLTKSINSIKYLIGTQKIVKLIPGQSINLKTSYIVPNTVPLNKYYIAVVATKTAYSFIQTQIIPYQP
jgi:outer membrane protein assembly factor BamB